MSDASVTARPQPWPSEVQKLVQEKQEHAYALLATKLGFGSDPAKAYAYLSGPQMPLSHVSWKKLTDQFGINLTANEEADLAKRAEHQFGHYFTEPPTPFEDKNRYVVMTMVLDEVLAAFATAGEFFEPKPVLATLPSGRVNAVVTFEKATRTPIIFLEQGLFRFLYDFSVALGSTLPVFSAQELDDDCALARHRGPHTVPFGGGLFSGALYEYVVSGTPVRAGSPLPAPTNNVLLSVRLLNEMSRFIVAHELSHHVLGHYESHNKTEPYAKEYEADAHALLVLSLAAQRAAHSRAFTFWACDTGLLCLDVLDRAMGLMAFGSTPGWVSPSHPNAYDRSRRLRELLQLTHITDRFSTMILYQLKCIAAWLGFGTAPKFQFSLSSLANLDPVLRSQITDTSYPATAQLGGMSHAIIGKLWELSSVSFLLAYQDGHRPSPMWKDRIASCFRKTV